MSEMLNRVAAFGAENSACGTSDPNEAPASACGAASMRTTAALGRGVGCADEQASNESKAHHHFFNRSFHNSVVL